MGKIRGFVKDADGNPLEGVLLKFSGKQGQDQDELETDDDGEYKTKTLESGDYKWTAQKGGYVTKKGEISGLPSGGSELENNITLEQPGSISGKVTDQADVGVEGAEVTATDAQNQVFGPVATDANGDYSIPNLAPETYTVTVQAPAGFQDPSPQPGVEVQAGQAVVDINFQLVAQPGSISGKVINQANAGVEGAQVTATDTQNQVFGPVVTDANGDYSIQDLAPETYTVTVQAPAGFQNPSPQPGVEVQAGQAVADINFQLAPGAQTGSISGKVTDQAGAAVQGAQVTAMDAQNQVFGPVATDANGNYTIADLPAGAYKVEVSGYLSARNVVVSPGVQIQGIDFSLNVVDDFLGRLDDLRFSIETPISILEANQAVSLFSVVNLMLAGLSQYRVDNEERTDILGVLNLYYGLQDGSLSTKLVVQNSDRLWQNIGQDLKALATELDQLQSDVGFLIGEAKRQYNLGTSNSVLGNAQFPGLFKRYVEIGTDPLLSINIRDAEDNQFFDKEKLEKAYDLLRELKGLLLQIVRSLSKYGTAATRRVNEDWAGFEARALEMLAAVAQEIVSEDLDNLNAWAALAVLTEKNRETEVAPHVVLARHGGKLLNYAMQIYLDTQDQLDNFDPDHLRELFQPTDAQPKDFWTHRIKKHADPVRRHNGLTTWG